MRVLIIEDNPTNLELMRYLLQAHGHAVTAAAGGEQGLRLAHDAPPDVIVCDVQMPGLDGFGVLTALRADERLKATPVVAVTASAMVGDRETVLAAGFDGYISKPIVPETFVDEISGFARHSRE